MSPMWFCTVAAAIPASSACSVTASSARDVLSTSPTGTVIAASVKKPL